MLFFRFVQDQAECHGFAALKYIDYRGSIGSRVNVSGVTFDGARLFFVTILPRKYGPKLTIRRDIFVNQNSQQNTIPVSIRTGPPSFVASFV